MTVDEIKKFVDYISNKEQSGNTLGPDEFNDLLKAANLDFTRYLYGVSEQYRYGAPQPPVAYEVSQYVTDAISVLKVIDKNYVVDKDGQSKKPANYGHYSSLRYTYSLPMKCDESEPRTKEVKIEVVKDDKLGILLGCAIKSPTKRYPIATFYNDYLQFYPTDLGKVIFTYLKLPAVAVRAYTVVGDSSVYDSQNSVQLEFPEMSHMEICRILLGYIGINLRDNELQVYNERFKQKGV